MTDTKPRRLRVQPVPDAAVRNVVLCPLCDQRMTLSLLLNSHLSDHQYGLFNANQTGLIQIEVTLLVEDLVAAEALTGGGRS